MTHLQFRVLGTPGAQGSKRHVGNGVMIESSKKVKPWRQDVVAAASEAVKQSADFTTFAGPVRIRVWFHFTRPKAHYRTGKHSHELRADAPVYVTSRSAGDADKLLRSTFDALTTVGVWQDDSLAADARATKVYSTWAGATIEISPIQVTA